MPEPMDFPAKQYQLSLHRPWFPSEWQDDAQHFLLILEVVTRIVSYCEDASVNLKVLDP